jgi:predicted lactoylglutathione lyase
MEKRQVVLNRVPEINEDFMFLRSIEDVDGYIWGIMYLDTNRFKSLKTPN